MQSRADLEGRIIAGGEASRKKFAFLFGIDDPQAPTTHEVTAVGWMGNHIEVEITDKHGKVVVFCLERYHEGKPCFLRIGELVIYFKGSGIAPILDKKMQSEGRARLMDVTIEELSGIVAEDAVLGTSREPLPQEDKEAQRTFERKAFLNAWGSTEVWSQFFATGEISRGRLDSLDLFNRCTFIQHGDQECLQVTPHLGVEMIPLVFYPWEDRLRRLPQERKMRLAPEPDRNSEKSDEGPGEHEQNMYTTDLNEYDAIAGSMGKMEKVLSHVLTKEIKTFLFCSCTCVPFVAGEDVESLVKRYQKTTDTQMFYLTTTPQSSTGIFRDVLVRRRLAAEAKVVVKERDPRAINLVGFPKDQAQDELNGMLSELGVTINTMFIPEMDFEVIAKFPLAGLNVFHPNVEWQHLYDQLLFDSNIKGIYPPAPYGLSRSRAWLASIAAATGTEGGLDEMWEGRIAEIQDDYNRLHREAARYRLGFIIGDAEVHRLTDPDHTWGVPLLAALEEMGFGLEVMFFAQDRKTAYDVATEINSKFTEPGRHTLKAFNNYERLQMLLGSDSYQAVFSEHFFDWRLTQAGKSQFSCQEFERGIQGTVNTMERLLTVCKLPLFKRYAKYLKRPPIAEFMEPEGDGPPQGAPPKNKKPEVLIDRFTEKLK